MSTADFWVDAADGRPAQVKALGTLAINLTNNGVAGLTRLWSVVDAPPGTTAVFSSATAPAPTYGPLDLAGTYMLRLAVDGAAGSWETDPQVDEIVVRVRSAGITLVIPAVGETTQGGVDGWADWISGMNDALTRLSAAHTLQGAYDNSTPPSITVAPAHGPLNLYYGVAVATPLLTAGDIGLANRLSFLSDGLLSLTGALQVAGEYVLDVNDDAGAVAGSGLLRLRDTTSGSSIVVAKNGTTIITTAGATNDGLLVTCTAPTSRLLNATAGATQRFFVDNTGVVFSWSTGGVWGLDLDALTTTTGLARFQDSAGSGGDPINFQVLNTGGILSHSKAAGVGLDVDAKAATTFVFRLQDTTNLGWLSMEPDGQMLWQGNLAANEEALRFVPLGALVSSDIIEVESGGATMWRLRADGNIFHSPEEILPNPAASIVWHHMDLTTMGAVINGETRRGFFLDGNSVNIAACGALIGFDSQLANNLGIAVCYRAVVDDQDAVVAYQVQAGSNPFTAYDRFCVADIGIHNWTGGASFGVGAGEADLVVAGGPTESIVIPVHVPHGATIVGFSVHVLDGGGGGIIAYLIHTTATSGATADQQLLLVATAASGAGVEQDLAIAVPAGGHVVPKQGAGAAGQEAYHVLVQSAQVGDVFYSGHVEYTYDELLKGD